MTGREFLNSLAHGQFDLVQTLLDILADTGSQYCVIGGLAVDAYVDPVVSLDIDILVAVEDIGTIRSAAADLFRWTVKEIWHDKEVYRSGF
jgi:hypothetical protein